MKMLELLSAELVLPLFVVFALAFPIAVALDCCTLDSLFREIIVVGVSVAFV